MCDYGNIEFNQKNDSINYSKIKINYERFGVMKTIEQPLFKTIKCVKVENDTNYDCEVTEYSLRLCLKTYLN